MARPKSADKRAAILEAAIAVIADEGVAATTATIARGAGISHGSLFQYFETKADLLNAAFLMLKSEIHVATLTDLPEAEEPLGQLRHLWVTWMHWGTSDPIRRRALSRLANEQVITPASRGESEAAMDRGIRIVQAVGANGVFKDQPIQFVARFFEALAATTMDAMIAEPDRAEEYCEISFKALSQALQ